MYKISATRSICWLLNYLLFSLFSGVFSLAARRLVSAGFTPPREYSPGSLQHETRNLVIYFKDKTKTAYKT